MPRVLVAKVTYAEKLRDDVKRGRGQPGAAAIADQLVQEVEGYLLAQSKPWARSGSTHPLNAGDYDFCSIMLSFLVVRHGPYGSGVLSQ